MGDEDRQSRRSSIKVEEEQEPEIIYTLEEQYESFSRYLDPRSGMTKSDGPTITLYQSDYWLRQAKILEDRRLTMAETGKLFYKFGKSELTYDEWLEYLNNLCEYKDLDNDEVEAMLTTCGLPGAVPVDVPAYRVFFDTYKSKKVMLLNLPWVAYCNATYDSYLCWPPTEAGATAFQNCPPERLSDTSQLAYRHCDVNGLWRGKWGNESDLIGWTNYTPCFPPAVQNLLKQVEADPQKMFQIAYNTRYMEIIGFSLSLIALIISLYIFCYFRSLRNIRTKIHRNLFLAMILQVIVRLVVYLDQAISRKHSEIDPKTLRGLDSLPYVCEACYISLEYGISAMFCWMFIEGLYLHSIVTANALREWITYRQYLILGWGTPIVVTCIWAVVTSLHYKNTTVQQCWYGYNFLNQYWVSQGPRLAIILINLVFLLNILRVLIGKLNRSADSEIEKARKAARAALVLLPLLGITNILNMIEAPLNKSAWKFALWSYTTHFLRSFQGLFIALIYCFMNGEVRQQVVKFYRDWQAMKNDSRRVRDLTRGRQGTPRHSSALKPLNWVQSACNNNCGGDTETDYKTLQRMDTGRNVLDNLHTIRVDEETNVTDGV